MQGYHFSKPVGASELEAFLAARAAPAPGASR
jgi:EAL domain-containing protein (putative c-di-GMP-specific phosphodiesterase class I)